MLITNIPLILLITLSLIGLVWSNIYNNIIMLQLKYMKKIIEINMMNKVSFRIIKLTFDSSLVIL